MYQKSWTCSFSRSRFFISVSKAGSDTDRVGCSGISVAGALVFNNDKKHSWRNFKFKIKKKNYEFVILQQETCIWKHCTTGDGLANRLIASLSLNLSLNMCDAEYISPQAYCNCLIQSHIHLLYFSVFFDPPQVIPCPCLSILRRPLTPRDRHPPTPPVLPPWDSLQRALQRETWPSCWALCSLLLRATLLGQHPPSL